MMPDNLPEIGDMIKEISANPAAREMLASLIGGDNHAEEVGDALPAMSEEDVRPVSAPASHRGGLKKHHALLCALRPYLSSRRCATLSRMERALELYEIIETARRAGGGNDVHT